MLFRSFPQLRPVASATGDVVELPVDLRTAADGLAGTMKGPQGEMEFDGGTVDGNDLAWSIAVTTPMAITLEFAATVDGDSLDEILSKHRRRESVRLLDRRPDLPPDFVEVVERAMEHDPQHRFASVGEMERDRKSTRLNSSHMSESRMPSSA